MNKSSTVVLMSDELRGLPFNYCDVIHSQQIQFKSSYDNVIRLTIDSSKDFDDVIEDFYENLKEITTTPNKEEEITVIINNNTLLLIGRKQDSEYASPEDKTLMLKLSVAKIVERYFIIQYDSAAVANTVHEWYLDYCKSLGVIKDYFNYNYKIHNCIPSVPEVMRHINVTNNLEQLG